VSPELRVRRATAADRDFLIEAIIESERGSASCVSYCEIFSLDETALRTLFASILSEDFEGQELCISGFLIAEADGAYAGAACGWLEGEAGMPSTLIKANLLGHFLDAARLQEARRYFARLEALAITREKGAAQLESIYVRATHRGRGVMGRILGEHLAQIQQRAPATSKAQIILVDANASARRAYEKLGFRVALQRRTDDPMLLPFVPGGIKILMERPISASRDACLEA